MKTKFTATFIGLIVSMICLTSIFEFTFPISLFLPLASIFPSIWLELIFQAILGKTDFHTIALAVIISEIVIFIGLSFWYYKKLILDTHQNSPFNKRKLIIYFVFLQFIIHPIGFYGWAMANNLNSGDGQFIFAIFETVPYSGLSFVFIGALVDIIRSGKYA